MTNGQSSNVTVPEARAALTGFVVHHMGHQLKSYDFMRQIGLDA